MVRLSAIELKRNDFILSVDKIFDTSSSYALMGENGSGKTNFSLAIFDIVQGIISTIMTSAGFGESSNTVLPQELITTIESCRIFREHTFMGSYFDTEDYL